MKIAVLQASSQKDKNALLYRCVQKAAEKSAYETVNLGVFPYEQIECNYLHTALCASLLLESRAVDFVVTGCSSGQGMMLACNSLPGVLCGYLPTPADAYLFGRINQGNAASLPLGLNFGWAAEVNLQTTLDRLFDGPLGQGYPPQDAPRKRRDAALVRKINAEAKRSLAELLPRLEPELVKGALKRKNVGDYLLKYGQEPGVNALLRKYL